jgi:hypothetical protein
LRLHDYVVHSGKQLQEGIRIRSSCPDAIEIHPAPAGDDSWSPDETHRVNARRQANLARSQVGIHFLFGKFGGVGIRTRLLSVLVNVVEFRLGTVNQASRVRSERKASHE